MQTFFTTGSERYFTVDYNEEDHEAVESSSNAKQGIEGDKGELLSLLSEFTTIQEKWQKELEIADAEVVKTDHTGWFNKNQ